jgi:hypothetical protein
MSVRRTPRHFLLAITVFLFPLLAAAQDADFNKRCSTRLSSALLGTRDGGLLDGSADPRARVDELLGRPAFVERFSRFINSKFNREPGTMAAEDATYYLTRHVLQNQLPWKEMFVGKFRVDRGATDTQATVVADANGLGYFRSPIWMKRYAGNEAEGYRLVTAYRMLNNVLGVELKAAQNTDGVDANGRKVAPCVSCHYNPTFGLDSIAKILSKRDITDMTGTKFIAPSEGPQLLFGTKMISDDAAFVGTMVEATEFPFHACRLAMGFLYGRDEYACEGPVFDVCMKAFAADGKITSAIGAIAKDPSFCQ